MMKSTYHGSVLQTFWASISALLWQKIFGSTLAFYVTLNYFVVDRNIAEKIMLLVF